jgi:hypothetical protein
VRGHEATDRLLAHVVRLEAAEEVVEQALAERAVRDGHRLQAEGLEHRLEDRDAAGDDVDAVRREPGQLHP